MVLSWVNFFRSNCNFTQGKVFCELLFCFVKDSSVSIYSIPPMILVDSMQRVGHNIDRTEEVEIMEKKHIKAKGITESGFHIRFRQKLI